MRYLTFNISGVSLGIKVDAVISVRKERSALDSAGKDRKVKPVILSGKLGLEQILATDPAVISCRRGDDIIEIVVDKVLDLENVGKDKSYPWPANLSFLKVYDGIIMVGQRPFLTLNIDLLTDNGKK